MSEESIKSTINNIFPTPIYTTKLDRELTSLELKFVDKIKKESYIMDKILHQIVITF